MSKLKFFLTVLLLLLAFHFCDMLVFASDWSGLVSDPDLYYFDIDYARSDNFVPAIIGQRNFSDGDVGFTSLDYSFAGNGNAPSVVPYGVGRYAFMYGVDGSGNPISVNSKPVFRLYYFKEPNTRYNYYSGFRYMYFRYSGDMSNKVWQFQNTQYYFMNPTDAGSSGFFLVGTNVPIFNDFSKMVDYLMNNNISESDVKNDELLGEAPVPAESLGYLSDVQYYVDTAAYLYDPENTPEYVKWGSKSTTGIDLTDSRYYVEFMCEDQSTFMRHNASDSFINETGVPFTTTASYIANRYAWASQYIFPSGSDQRALLGGKAAKTSLYGSASGLGSVPASAGMFKYSAAAQYKKALANDSDSDKGLIYGFINDVTSLNFTPQQKLFNNYQSSGKALNWTYNLYARIVDTTSGASGDWLKIDRHNAPWELGSDERQLNGGTTITTGHRFVNYNPDTNVFVTLPDDTGDTYVNQPITTGYTLNGDYQPTYNNITNYNYNYYDYGDNINNINNIYVPYDNTPTNVGETISKGLDIAKFLNVIPMIFMFCFGPMLPAWIVPVVTAFFALVAVVGLFNLVRRLVGR